MNKVKSRFITILSLGAALALSLGAGAALAPTFSAQAEPGTVDYRPTAVFAAGTGGEVEASEAAEGSESFVQFTFKDGGNVYFRRDLAYKWYTAADAEEASTLANPGKANYLSMRFALPASFKLFKVSFESAEENVSKEGKSVNSLLFRIDGENLQVAVKSALQQDLEDTSADLTWNNLTTAANATRDITVAFSEATEGVGNFAVEVSSAADGATAVKGTFSNIGGNYAEYRSSSSSTPNTPIIFHMDLAEGSEEGAEAAVLIKSLNGQSFTLTDGMVKDNTAPVLAVSRDVHSFRLGQRYNYTSYEAIDVCRDSVSVTRAYYMAKATDTGYEIADESATGSDSKYSTLTTSTYFMPTASTTEDLKDEYVSIRLTLTDGRSDANEYVYLTWYAADTTENGGIVKTLSDGNAEGEKKQDFLVVTPSDRKGPVYTGLTVNETESKNDIDQEAYDAAVKAYQDELTAIAEDTKAGSGSYFYLPSLRGLISSDYADYRDLRFTIYYWHNSQEVGSTPSSESSLSYNNLRFEVDKEGTYTFRIVAEDSAGNAMQLYHDGELVTLSSSTIGYDADGENFEIDVIPTFTVSIGYDGASIEDPGSQDYGYRDRTYTLDSFDVIALEGYASDYSLYYFNTSKLAAGQTAPSYAECVENAEALFFAEGAPYADCIELINPFNSDVTEEDEAWADTDNDYAWNPDSSLSFVPQRSGIYFVRLTVTEQTGATVSQLMSLEVRNPVDIIPGVSNWLQNNTLSVVLFSISGVLAIVIILLFVIKPTDKTVEEIDLDKLKGKKKTDKK